MLLWRRVSSETGLLGDVAQLPGKSLSYWTAEVFSQGLAAAPLVLFAGVVVSVSMQGAAQAAKPSLIAPTKSPAADQDGGTAKASAGVVLCGVFKGS